MSCSAELLDSDWEKLQIDKCEGNNADKPVEKLHCAALDGRLSILQQFFKDTYDNNPDFIVSVPGRVNLIGEHVDYSGYGVIPMAVEQRVLIALRANGSEITTLVNMEKKYEKAEIDSTFRASTKPLWYHYFQCGIQGALEYSEAMKYKGMDVAVWGNIPPNAGLSSSSALVSAAAICMFLMNEPTVPLPGRKELADLCAKAERLIGTQGGGMDQAIAFLATEGYAKHIEFDPLRCVDVQLPKNAVFVVAHSMVEKNKAASNVFNTRVEECRLAAKCIAAQKRLSWQKVRTLSDVQKMLECNPQKMASLVGDILSDQGYSRDQIASFLGISSKELEEVYMSHGTKDVEEFYLKNRARHVYQEVARVYKFKNCCETLPEKDGILVLGKLLTESHESLKNLFECSDPALDELVDISRSHTLGARMVGAGWGGCIVALTTADKVDQYKEDLKRNYYSSKGVGDAEFGNFVFVTRPGSGAQIHVLNPEKLFGKDSGEGESKNV
ncbi:N-acetylgalactosamine kinase-like [Coccinella septempunctata]|uniref:N-acetylgalactosamine kinase-like n=1 Tax=Coccinella septempunctata TaxID=41139 RepID=UPI001D060C77|nr:N-acetylgalactosamine kinase-like [Coccinella septempunctata]